MLLLKQDKSMRFLSAQQTKDLSASMFKTAIKATALSMSLLSISVLSIFSTAHAQTNTSANTENAQQLPSLSLDLSNVTVSGLSSGGYMATQFQLAHSDWVKGVGVIAGGPYYCAKGDITTALAQCVNKIEGSVDLEAINKQIARYESEGKIAPISNMKDAKVWLFHGTQDTRVITQVSDLLHQQYQSWQTQTILRTSTTNQWPMYFRHNQTVSTAWNQKARLSVIVNTMPPAPCSITL